MSEKAAPHRPVDESAVVPCSWCGEPLHLPLDPSAGRNQDYVEDCAVCCRPNVVRVRYDADGRVQVSLDRED